jgi:hypothetical protein
MPMPQESPTISLVGQGQPNSPGSNQGTSVGNGFAIVEEFGDLPPLGARQDSPSSVTAMITEKPNIQIPSGASIRPSLKLPTPGRSPKLQTRQLWEGTVTEVRDGGFVAILNDKTDPANPDEQGEFEFESTEISAEDRLLICPGSSFYWIIGTQQTHGGQVMNVSMVQFRRLPLWTQRTLAEIASRVQHSSKISQEDA